MLYNDFNVIFTDRNLDLSVKNGADVTIGHKFYLDIELIPQMPLPKSFNVEIKDSIGFEYMEIINHINTQLDSKSYNMRMLCIVNSADSLNSGDEISFTLTGIEKKIKYYAKDLVKSSIQLNKNKSVCVTPNNNNNVDNNTDHYIQYFTTLFDTSGQLLRNTPVQIYSKNTEDIEKNIIITTEPDNTNQKPQILKPILNDDKIEITINSDKDGNIKFRVYPIMDTPAVIDIISKVEGVTEYRSGPIYMISVLPPSSEKLLAPPELPELYGDSLEGDGRKSFEAQINSYTNASRTDNVLFFNKKKGDGTLDPTGLILPVKKISDVIDAGDSDSSDYSFLMRRDIFPNEKKSIFYYIIAPNFGNGLYSDVQGVEYIGGELTSPNSNVKRIWNTPIIFSSFADIKNDPKLERSDDEKKENNEDIIQIDISNAPVSGYQLCAKIMCTNDENDQSYPIWGKEIYFRMYVRSGNQNFNRIFKLSPIHTPDNPQGKLATVVIKIDSPELNDVKAYQSGGAGMIYFEYYTIDPVTQEKTYSNYWQNQIITSD
ncbi:hypothetical protein FE394_14065 [Xenorhabdus sp. Reich]|uniref:Inverse autotransporter beta-barrel domain-containing protein n=1 Tax=Xenorhabdus littoralis TaxID=2582835 RepID=A0ABU4SNY2_9GAMM|nr:hypothetical protein [Xenorhabdus sp. Reich]MDX8000291.1 hypothetical protein [Xenorhabdus sp. Reich]